MNTNKHKLLNLFFISLLITMVAMIPIYGNSIFNGQDLTFHLSRIDGLWSCIQDRQLPFAIYPFKNYSYGYASPLFYCDIFLILPAVLYRLGVPLVLSYKILIFIITLVGCFGMCYAGFYIFKKYRLATISTMLWAFSSYRILDLFIRSALGEAMALSVLPFLMLALYQYFVEEKNNFLFLGISFAALLFCHNISFVMAVAFFAVLLIIYSPKIWHKVHMLKTLALAFLIGIGLSAFYLLPMIEQLFSQSFTMQTTLGTMLEKGMPFSRFFEDFIIQNLKSDISHPLNYLFTPGLLSIMFLPLPLFIKNPFRSQAGFFKILAIISIVLVLFTSDYFNFINQLPIFSFLQFPWRVFTITTILSPVFFSYFIFNITNINFKRIAVSATSLFLVINTFFVYKTIVLCSEVIPNGESNENLFSEQIYKPYGKGVYYNISELGGGEYLPDTYGFDYREMGSCIAFPNYEAAICDYSRNGSRIEFTSNFPYTEDLLMPLTYYKGYKAYEVDEDNNIIKEIPVFSEKYSKRVTINSQEGLHHYLISYDGTSVQKISLAVSSLTFVIILIINIKHAHPRRRSNKCQS